jgi:hypothetical protein
MNTKESRILIAIILILPSAYYAFNLNDACTALLRFFPNGSCVAMFELRFGNSFWLYNVIAVLAIVGAIYLIKTIPKGEFRSGKEDISGVSETNQSRQSSPKNLDDANGQQRMNTTLVSQQSQSVGSSHPNQVSARSFDGERELTNDAYKIYLTKKYNFEKNEILGKIACEGSLFDSVEEALMHAHALEQQQQDSLQANAENEQKRLELAKDLGIEEKAFGHGYKVLGQKFYDLDDAIAFARKERAKRAG